MQYELTKSKQNKIDKLKSKYQIESIEITSNDEYIKNCEVVKSVKTDLKEIEGVYEKDKQKAYEKHKAICDAEKEDKQILIEAEKILKKAIGSYQLQHEESNTVENPLDPLKVKGISSQDIYKWKVVDLDILKLQWKIGDAPLFIVNEEIINQLVKATKGTINIPGIEIIKEKSVRVKG